MSIDNVGIRDFIVKNTVHHLLDTCRGKRRKTLKELDHKTPGGQSGPASSDLSFNAFSVGVLIFGDASAPSVFGARGGAIVTYEASNSKGPLLSHVDALVPSV